MVDLIRECCDRAGPAFAYVKYVKNAWSGTSRGFKFTCSDLTGFEAALVTHPSLCKNTPFGKREHKDMTTCYREIVAGAHGLHACLGTTECELHIDLHQTVKKKDYDGTCNYRWGVPLLEHLSDVKLGMVAGSPFETTDQLEARALWLDQHLSEAPELKRDRLLAQWAALKPEANRLVGKARAWAVLGEAGERAAASDPNFSRDLDRTWRQAGMITFEIEHPEAP